MLFNGYWYKKILKSIFFVQSIFHYENCALLRPIKLYLDILVFFSSNTYGMFEYILIKVTRFQILWHEITNGYPFDTLPKTCDISDMIWGISYTYSFVIFCFASHLWFFLWLLLQSWILYMHFYHLIFFILFIFF